MKWVRNLGLVAVLFAIVVYFGLPRALTAMGLNPAYDMPDFNLADKRVLIITTSQATLGEGGKATGVYGSELTVPYYAFLDGGLTVDVASIKGGAIPVEPYSMGWPLAAAEDYRFLKDTVAMAKLTNSIPITAVDIGKYDAVFLSGGWGAAYDFGQSTVLGALITAANAEGAVLGSVCHGALGFLQAKNPDGTAFLQGRHVTAVTDRQITQLGVEITPLHPEREVRAAGALFQNQTAFRDIFATGVVVDGRLVTGQNQNSGPETAARMMELLDQQ
mgnify:CR=1 FL=1